MVHIMDPNLRNLRDYRQEDTVIVNELDNRLLVMNSTNVDDLKEKGMNWFEENKELASGIGVGVFVLLVAFCICRRCRR